MLVGSRLGLNGQIYIFPTSAMALLFVAIMSPQIAIIGVLGLAMLVGVMANGSLEIASLVAAGGIIGALSLKRAERLNNFFLAGLMVAINNIGIVAIFNLSNSANNTSEQLLLLMIFSLLNGILTAAAAIAGLYIVTLIFNLPTALKLAELSQPNQPLLQRLLREAPGTYQHSLQVANLSEQATNAIGGNAELVHVAALYHDIGKMLNAPFFTENQRDIGNPHDTLNDPYRSADIIVGHVTDGDEMAKQNRLPNRLRDFIREHHGTSEVYVFYKQAVILAGDDESAVDINDFSYPGPKPQSRETAVLMLADSCEAAVRSRQPKSKDEVEETVLTVIEGKRKSGQLDESGLTFNDIKVIREIFVEMLQSIYHPRINYEDAIARVRKTDDPKPNTDVKTTSIIKSSQEIKKRTQTQESPLAIDSQSVPKVGNLELKEALEKDEDDSPLPEVPRLRRVSDTTAVNGNGSSTSADVESSDGSPEPEEDVAGKSTPENASGE
ncbi:MAG: HDIG domain-containing protein [Aggregatilineales bacterium]